MIEIIDNHTGRHFTTDKRTKVRLEINNNIFPDVGTKSRTLPFTLPSSNNIAFGAPHRDAAEGIKTSYDVTLKLRGQAVQSGKMQYLSSLADGSHSVRIQIDDTLSKTDLTDITLVELFKNKPIDFDPDAWKTNPYVRFPRIKNERFFGDATPPAFYTGYLNQYKTDLSPQPIVKHLLNETFKNVGLNISGAFMEDGSELSNLLLYANHHVAVADMFGGNGWKNLLPENLKAKDLVKLVQDMFCLTSVRKGNNVELVHRKDVLAGGTSKGVDWTRKVHLPATDFKPTPFELKFDAQAPTQSEAPKGFVADFSGVMVGDEAGSGKQVVQLAAPPLAYDPNNILEIWDNVVGSSSWENYKELKTEKTPIRFMFYRPHPSLRAASSVAGENDKYGLNIEGEKGLYEVFWRDWVEMLKLSVVRKGKAYLSFLDLANLDLTKKIRVGNRDYLLKKLSTVFSQAQGTTLECDVELVRIPI